MPRAGRPCASESEGRGLSEDCPKRLELVRGPILHRSVTVTSIAYSPDGQQIVSGSTDETIQIWDTKIGAAVGKPLTGHTDKINSVCFAPNGQYIISGSGDKTIRIWDASTGAPAGKPLEGHTAPVWSIAYSPGGDQIISGSSDCTIRIWDAKRGSQFGMPLRGHSGGGLSVAYSPSGRHIVSGSGDSTIRVWDSFAHLSIQPSSSCDPVHAQLYAQADPDGWVRDLEDGLLYWVPPDYREGLHAPSLLTIHLKPDIQSVSLSFEDVAIGKSWSQIFN